MPRHSPLRFILAVAFVAAACSDNGPVGPADGIKANNDIASSGTVGTTIPVSMKVVDANGRPVANSRVRFMLTSGDGAVAPQMVLSNAAGVAETQLTLGQTAGTNTLNAAMDLAQDSATVVVEGVASTAVGVAISPKVLRIQPGTASATVVGSQVDKYGNKTTGVTVVLSRNTAVVKVDSVTGAVTVVGSGSTYIVASGGGLPRDSSLVTVLTAADPACAGLTTKVSLAVGEVMTTGFVDNTVCIAASATGGEYAIVPYFDSPVPSVAQGNLVVSVFGVKTPGALGDLRRLGTGLIGDQAADDHAGQIALENRVLGADQRELPARAALAREWYARRVASRGASRAIVAPAVGDKMKLNGNSIDFCINPDFRTGRVVAVTTRAIVVVDSANPAQFAMTDAEYAAYGAQFDTISYPLDVANFGEPTDIDNNGRIIVFFTHTVNEAGFGVLGFFFGRDLLPKVGEFGSCAGSNVGEVINLLVPDAIINKSYVNQHAVETMSHEFQHLINGARRLYINKSAAISEERWLNEGLSHIAEELTFFKVSGLPPRQNIGSVALKPPADSVAFKFYGNDNFLRLKYYLGVTDIESPIALDDLDSDKLETRGAIWSYLRYVADQRFPQTETTLWSKLVNSNTSGLQNLYDAIGTDARSLMRDWTLAIYLDDLTTGVNAKYQMLSWNYRQVATPYFPKTMNLADKASSGINLEAGGTIFARFATSANTEAFVSAQGTGSSSLPKHILLALVRTK